MPEEKEEEKVTKKQEKEQLKKKIVERLVHPMLSKKWSPREKAADLLTEKLGSWTFIIIFIIFLALWISANAYAWVNQWDPYPFILLNLALSCLAAIQAPIILMSQNREAQKDRVRTEFDYAINRRAEREIKKIKLIVERLERKLSKG